MNKNTTKKQRHHARRLAMQALYQWHFNDTEAHELIAAMLEVKSDLSLDRSYFKILVEGAIKDVDDIDAALQPVIDRQLKELNPVELAILRVSTYEMLHKLEVPYRVIINEGVELAKEFGSDQGYKYINGVLDKLASLHRCNE